MNTSISSPTSKFSRYVGLLLGLLAGAVYLLTLSRGPFPGESASLIATHSGLAPQITDANPFWSAFVWVLVHIPIYSLAARLNIFSAICGAMAVGLLYRVVFDAVYNNIDESTTDRTTAATAAQLAGISAALFLAFCIPFWYVSNRAHTASFDVLLLLTATHIMAGYMHDSSRRRILLFAFVYGLGTVEFATFITLAPVFLIGLLAMLWEKHQLNITILVKLAACYCAGLLLYAIAAWHFYLSDGYGLLQLHGFHEILWNAWYNQYFLIAHSLPRQGWLLVAITGIIPWFACLLVARRGLNADNEWGTFIMHLAMTAIALMLLFDIKISPWRLLGTRKVLVTPYVLMASVYGYLVAYWYLLPKTLGVAERPVQTWLTKWLGPIIISPAIIAVCATPFLNLGDADARPAKAINDYARTVIRNMDGRTLLVSDGQLPDDVLLIAAHDIGKRITLIDASLGSSEAYMRYVGGFFTSPRLKSMAQVGMTPLLLELFATDRDIDSKAAVFSMPDLWLSSGMNPVPNKTTFLGTRDIHGINADRLFLEHQNFWADITPALQKAAACKTPIVPILAANLLRHASLAANDLGVLLADLGHTNDAFAAYTRARELCPKNICALLNQYSMINEGYQTDMAATIRKQFDGLIQASKDDKQFYIRPFTRFFGYISSPEAFASYGWAWTRSASPALAIANMKKAADLKHGKSDQVGQSLTFLDMTQNQDKQNETLYRELLTRSENDGNACLALANIAMKNGDLNEAATMLGKAEQKGAPKAQIALQRAALQLTSGNPKEARIILDELVNTNPDMPQAWFMLAGVLALQQDQGEALDRSAKRLSEIKGQDFLVAVALGQIALARNNTETARKQFDLASSLRPNALPVLQALLRLDFLEGQHNLAMKHILDILSMDPNNSFANYVLGSMQLATKDYELAESSLQKSLETEKSPAAMNDLAWLLTEKGEYPEAEKLVRAAIEMNGKQHQAYDTLGVILLRTKRLDDAEKALNQALAIDNADLHAQMHMAEIQIAKVNKTKALEIIEMLTGKRNQLPVENQNQLDELRRKAQSM